MFDRQEIPTGSARQTAPGGIGRCQVCVHATAVTPTVRPGSFVEYKLERQTALHHRSMSPRFTLAIKKQLLVSGVRYARQEVAPAVGHGGGCKFFAFRRSPLAHGGVDGCGPLVDAFGIGVANDEAAGGRC